RFSIPEVAADELFVHDHRLHRSAGIGPVQEPTLPHAQFQYVGIAWCDDVTEGLGDLGLRSIACHSKADQQRGRAEWRHAACSDGVDEGQPAGSLYQICRQSWPPTGGVATGIERYARRDDTFRVVTRILTHIPLEAAG